MRPTGPKDHEYDNIHIQSRTAVQLSMQNRAQRSHTGLPPANADQLRTVKFWRAVKM